MQIIDKLASSLGRRDEVPNQLLAREIAEKSDKAAVQELAGLLQHQKKDIHSDALKALYELAYLRPDLVAPYHDGLIRLLDSKNNRLQWGAMIGLDAIAHLVPDVMYGHLAKIIAVADKGSVITNDHCVGILAKLSALPQYAADAFPLLLERIMKSPVNQLPAYSEKAQPVCPPEYRDAFLETLRTRLADVEQGSKRKRMEKVIKRLRR